MQRERGTGYAGENHGFSRGFDFGGALAQREGAAPTAKLNPQAQRTNRSIGAHAPFANVKASLRNEQ